MFRSVHPHFNEFLRFPLSFPDDLSSGGGRSRRSTSHLRLLKPHLIYAPRSHQFEKPLDKSSGLLNTASNSTDLIEEEDENGEEVFVKGCLPLQKS